MICSIMQYISIIYKGEITIKEKLGMIILFLIAILYKLTFFIYLKLFLRKDKYREIKKIKEINDYIVICGGNTIHMNPKVARKQFKSSCDLGKLNELCDGFVDGLKQISSEVDTNSLPIGSDNYTVITHEVIFKNISRKYIIDKKYYKIIGNKFVKERLLLINLKDIFNHKKYIRLKDKKDKYKITINIKDINCILQNKRKNYKSLG